MKLGLDKPTESDSNSLSTNGCTIRPFVRPGGVETNQLGQWCNVSWNCNKNVLPMIHVDANANQSYEFPEGGDVPVMVNEEMVVATLELSY